MLWSGIEKILNRSLPRSPRAQALAQALAGRSVAVEITGGPTLRFFSTGTQLTLLAASDTDAAGAIPAAADATVTAGPFTLLALTRAGPQDLSERGATIRGDAEVAQQFSELLRLLAPDPEEELAQWVGDAPAHHLGRLARTAGDFGANAARTAVRNLAEYLAHERRDLVPKAEGRQLLDGIDRLRDDVDRFEARLAHLAQRRGRPMP